VAKAEEQVGVDFFISYTQTDRSWAEWIAWELEAAGFTTLLQAWDFAPGTNFLLEMDRAARTATRTIAVLSPTYLTSSLYTRPEWAAALARDPTGVHRALIPVRVQPFLVTGLLAQLVYLDLVDKDAEAARQELLDGLRPGRLKPTVQPPFPSGRRQDPPPAFPGATPAPFRIAARNPSFTGGEQHRHEKVRAKWLDDDELVVHYTQRLYRMARIRLGDKETAEGAVLETWSRARDSITAEPSNADFYDLLYAICKDVCEEINRDIVLQRAIGDMEPGLREALLLHLDGFSSEEIGRKLGLPLERCAEEASSHVERARMLLAQALLAAG
jgi:DNA-directed RNA polymerase specialized sigma24 family protein